MPAPFSEKHNGKRRTWLFLESAIVATISSVSAHLSLWLSSMMTRTLFDQRLFFLLLIVTLFGFGLAACPAGTSTCDPEDPMLEVYRLTTEFSIFEIKGAGATVYPKMPNGQAFEQAYISYYWRDILEKLPTPLRPDGGGGQCPGVTEAIQTETVRSLNISESCCSMTVGWQMLAPNVNSTLVVVNITNPDMPGFFMLVNTTVANDTLEIPQFGGINIDFENYTIDYSPKFAKISMGIYNWDWNVLALGGSWLRARLFVRAQLEELGTLTIRDGTISSAFDLLSSRARIAFDYFTFYYLNGQEFINQIGARKEPFIIPDQRFVSSEGDLPLGTLTFCLQNRPLSPRWTSVTYDPSLSALFIPSKRNKTVDKLAIALGTVAGVVVVVLVIMAIKSGVFKNLIRPFRARKATKYQKEDSWTAGVKPSGV